MFLNGNCEIHRFWCGIWTPFSKFNSYSFSRTTITSLLFWVFYNRLYSYVKDFMTLFFKERPMFLLFQNLFYKLFFLSLFVSECFMLQFFLDCLHSSLLWCSYTVYKGILSSQVHMIGHKAWFQTVYVGHYLWLLLLSYSLLYYHFSV